MKGYLNTYNPMKYFLPYLSRFWLRPLFTPNFRGGFRVLKPKSRDLLPRNLVQTYNWLIDWCIFILLSQESDGALYFGRIRTRLGVDHFPSFTVDVLTSSHVNLLLVRSYQAEIIIRAVGLETNILWSRSRSWSRLFCTGLGLGLEPLWSRSRCSKIGLETR